jgi:hypothetical protein
MIAPQLLIGYKMNFTHKLVAILNKDLKPGTAMNALAHMVLGLGAHVGPNLLNLDTYLDKDKNFYPNISQMPFIVLKAKSSEIRKTVQSAREFNILHGAFLNTMTGGSFQEQIEKTSNIPEESLIFYGIVLFGDIEKVNQLTKKFSLYQ